ncbi:hypothetical protein [Alloactinosynnema sp. L-07]|uniref:hypothetical protein n=1 Tax=Alloactinosynnema sp. L-07 TaxID=1653480 RepID=UPI00065EF1CD|nr:hypothetical protein [Alloactinosynnema sp. L-07]CRK60368.1 hypothetical protein [Alloactinosynnema sp. L-07]
MTEAIARLDADTRDQLLQFLGVSDAQDLLESDEGYDEVISFFEEQVNALLQEMEAVQIRVAYLADQLEQYAGVQR